MADDLTRRGPEDPKKINVNEEWEVEYWCKKWGITPKQLKDAVKAVGVETKKVAEHLGKKP